jgi:uncharacterized membrane protein YkvA (DUF1232 family)
MKENYSKHYNEQRLWKKIGEVAKQAGLKVVYSVLLLYYVMSDGRVDLKTKAIVVGALGYFILPTDAIFDLTPIIGFTDDYGVLIFALNQVSSSITPEIRDKANAKLMSWFGTVDDDEIAEIDNNLN